MESLTSLESLAEQVARGGRVTAEDARVILEGHDLIAIGMLGDDARRQKHGARTTFVRVFEVHADALPPALPSPLEAGELRIVGCPASRDAVIGVVRAARALGPELPLTGFTLAALRGVAGAGFGSFCRDLRAAGLEAVASVDVDAPGASITELAADTAEARAVGLAVSRLTVERLVPERRLAIVEAAAALQEAAGGFAAFAPLPRAIASANPTTGYDDIKQIVVARLVAAGIPSIQVDWALYGPKLAQVALTVGADDVDGVAAFDPGTLGTRRSAIEEIRRNIAAASLEAVERDGLFRTRS